jgi:capsular polysaccharide biosynthesis protein
VTVTCTDPAMAQKIVNTIIDVAPNEIIRVVKAGAVE